MHECFPFLPGAQLYFSHAHECLVIIRQDYQTIGDRVASRAGGQLPVMQEVQRRVFHLLFEGAQFFHASIHAGGLVEVHESREPVELPAGPRFFIDAAQGLDASLVYGDSYPLMMVARGPALERFQEHAELLGRAALEKPVHGCQGPLGIVPSPDHHLDSLRVRHGLVRLGGEPPAHRAAIYMAFEEMGHLVAQDEGQFLFIFQLPEGSGIDTELIDRLAVIVVVQEPPDHRQR